MDGELQLGRLYNRYLSGFCAFENTAGVDSDVPSYLYEIGAVTHQATRCHHAPIRKSRRNPFTRGQCGKLCTAAVEESIRGDEEGIGSIFSKHLERGVDLA